jgi:hypothetical protein
VGKAVIKLPSECRSLLSAMKGKRLVRVVHELFPPDYEYFPPETREELSDGSLELFLEGDLQICFLAFTEPMSVGVVLTPGLNSWVRADVSRNRFWTDIVGEVVQEVSILQARTADQFHAMEFGILISMAKGRQFRMEYISDADFLDTMRVMPGCEHIDAYTFHAIPL